MVADQQKNWPLNNTSVRVAGGRVELFSMAGGSWDASVKRCKSLYLYRVEGTIDMDGGFLSSRRSLFRQLDHGVGQALELTDVGTALANDPADLRSRGQNLYGKADVHATGETLLTELLVNQVLGLEQKIYELGGIMKFLEFMYQK